jgi:predicted alpha/beta superfamily hydrolase
MKDGEAAEDKQEIVSAAKPIVGSVRYHRDFPSIRLRYSRDIIVWLPPSYETNLRKRYPVLYVHDGQNLMDPTTAFLGTDWQLDETANTLMAASWLQEFIIVGIYNTPDRNTEYTGGLRGQNYAQFVILELKPFIDSIYRTRPDFRNTAVMGSSLGGLISLYFAWWYPDVFYQAASLSGSFFWNRKALIKQIQNYAGPKKRIRIYLDVGSREGLLRSEYFEMVKALEAAGYTKGLDLQYYLGEGDEHNEESWGRRVWRPLLFMFPGKEVVKPR